MTSDKETGNGQGGNHECVVCGQSERPENGWRFKSSDVIPVETEDGDVELGLKDDANAFCSKKCSDEWDEEN